MFPKFHRVRTVTCDNGYLKCSCKFRARFGIDCAHVYHVASQYDGYTEPSHHECSVRWWSSHYLYCNKGNTSDTSNENNLIRCFKLLEKVDLKGLPIAEYNVDHVDVVEDSSLYPEQFMMTKFPKCINYPHLQVTPKDLDEISHVSGTTFVLKKYSQAEDIPSSQDEKDDGIADLSVSYGWCDQEKMEEVVPSIVSPYQELLPYFSEMTSYMEEYASKEDISNVKNYFQEQVGHYKAVAYEKIGITYTKKRKGKIVSSTIPLLKRKKPHGTKY